jgi:putative Mn2+ efflux pump MntP
VLKLPAFVLPLGLDSFAFAAAIGASQAITAWQRLRISLVFVLFEGGMPLIGLGLGTALARGIGQVADYLAGAAVIAIGAWMLLAGDKDEEEKAARIITSRGLAFVALGLASAWTSWPSDSPSAWLICPSPPSSWPSPCRPS